MSKSRARKRIAILGGGCGSMAALWGLLQSDQADDFEITVYQIGWRLGGKGASGRNSEVGYRIEEHGLHLWQGMYENAFRMMRSVYGSLDRPRAAPLSEVFHKDDTFVGAFTPMDNVSLAEFDSGTWAPWQIRMPQNEDLPGNGSALIDPVDIIEELINGLIETATSTHLAWEIESALQMFERLIPASLAHVLGSAHPAKMLRRIIHAMLSHRHIDHLHNAKHHANKHARKRALGEQADHRDIRDALMRFETVILDDLGDLLKRVPSLRHLYLITNMVRAVSTGLIEDQLFDRGFDTVDEEEFSAWLKRHGASDDLLDSALLRGWYAFYFAAPQASFSPGMSAATGLRTLIRCNLSYKGAYFWKMSAGMGDTVFAPIYEMAKKHSNVHFEFFTAVRELRTDGRHVTEIDIDRQIDLAQGTQTYEPLIDVKGLPCWPSEPLVEQLNAKQAKKLKCADADLERLHGNWIAVSSRTLRLGEDFDQVILGIAQPALRSITSSLAEASEPWEALLSGLTSTGTHAAQLWFNNTPEGEPWLQPPSVGTAFAEPFNTWANMSHVLDKEDWTGTGLNPRSLVYLCDAAEDPPHPQSAYDPGTGSAALKWLGHYLPILRSTAKGHQTKPDWHALTSPPTQTQIERFEHQYWRNNAVESERYVLSQPGTAKFRLRADESGFENLFLAGDWLATGLNVGCVEAAVMGGLQASQAISNWPTTIFGDGNFFKANLG